jgi:hypothetical protein
MKEFNLEEYNKMCAKFLGWKQNNHYFIFDESTHTLCLSNVFIEDLKFDSDWNWIMEVVEKIQGILIKFSDEFCIEFYEGLPEEKVTYVSFANYEGKSKNSKEAVVQAIWGFLNMHKESKE